MNTDLAWLTGLLAFFWFLIYWVLGGVAFALLLILRLGRVRKVRFSCLFTLLAIVAAIGAAKLGVSYSQEAVMVCLAQATNRAQVVTAIFGCGFVGVVGCFALGACVLILGGLLLMFICRRQRPPTPTVGDSDSVSGSPAPDASAKPTSKYF
jgi:hypothetical protein